MYRKEKTWHTGGGDHPLINIQSYRYTFMNSAMDRFKPRRHVVYLNDFENRAVVSQYIDHKIQTRRILLTGAFFKNDRNLLEWFHETVLTDSAVLTLEIDASVEYVLNGGKGKYRIEARFRNPGHALIFKLAFGGK